jgi:centromere/kinetochore protein ZW10
LSDQFLKMSVDTITPAILQYIDHNAYPDSEAISSAELTSTSLEHLSASLSQAQNAAKQEISSLSRVSAPDIDTWIQRAKELQADILRSRETARQIVEEAELGKSVREEVKDKEEKVRFLEKEVAFNEQLARRLEGVGTVKELVAEGRQMVVEGNFGSALEKLTQAEKRIRELGSGETGVGGLLGGRVESLRNMLKEAVLDDWSRRVVVDVDGRKVTFNRKDGLSTSVDVTKGLELFDSMVNKSAKDIDRAIVKPRLHVGRTGVPRIIANETELRCEGKNAENSSNAAFEDLRTTLKVLSTELPPSVAVPLSQTLIPLMVTRLENEWLDAAVPLDVEDMPAFQAILDNVVGLADYVDELEWHGSEPLREWVTNAPRTWLTKRRETVLGDVRNLVFIGLRETKVVERVETQMVAKEDAINDGGEDEWDTAWDEPEPELSSPQKAPPPVQNADEDDDASAWEADFQDETPKPDGGDEEDAWGWGDGDDTKVPKSGSPEVTSKDAWRFNTTESVVSDQPADRAEREVTLREKFTVTAVPDGIQDLIQQVIQDAETLAGPEYSSSPIAPAANALYTLPTLALAIYRATATTAYAKLPTGNMLIYNDSSRLADCLRAWQATQPPASRLRLDNDVAALEAFAKKAYSTEMESQRTILRDLLEGAQGFSNCSTQPFKSECESAVEGTVHRLREVHKQWEHILSPSALLQSTGSLLATVTSKMITEIQDLPDIGEADSKTLKELCDTASQVKDLFKQTAPDGSERDMTFVYCPNWLKFQYLAEIMESSLADIKYLWGEGELSLEFEAEEVVGLIEALFAESGLRRSAIVEIRRGGRGGR